MDRPSWNLKELRAHVRRQSADRRFVLDALSSLDWADQIFRYHFCTARDALRKIPIVSGPNSVANFELMFSSSEDHEHHMLIVQANVIACIHTVRNTYDHLAQLCNALLISPPIPVKNCDLRKVHKGLPDSDLREQLDLLVNSHWFQYVAAYSNNSKHRTLVQQSLHFSFADSVAGIRAESFIHDKHYPAYMVGELLEGILEVKNHIIACGRALNAEVLPANV